MSASTRLEYSEAVQLLEYVHRTFRWGTFLLKNTFGLTYGHEPIPAQHHRCGITYDINDLTSLAHKHAEGKISLEHIHKRGEEFMNKMQHNHTTNRKTSEHDQEEAEIPPLGERIDQAIDNVVLLAKALCAIQLGIRTVGLHSNYDYAELEALGRVAEDYSTKAYKIAEDLDAIQETLHDDEGDCEPNIDDDELEALMGRLEAA